MHNGDRAGSRPQSGSRATNTDNNGAIEWELAGPYLPSLSQRQDSCGGGIYPLGEQCLKWKDIHCY